MSAVRRTVALAAALSVPLAGGCWPAAPGSVAPLRLSWQQVSLPVPAGPPGRIMVRDLVGCAGRWFVVGAVAGSDGSTRPAAWSSTDAHTWTALETVATSYHGGQNVLSAAGCRDGRVAAVGAHAGGAHGNLRVSTWTQVGGRLTEVAAPFERYGGPEAVNVGRVAGGPAGWLIVGNRSGGAAVWVSPDSATFELIDEAPQLMSDERGRTLAFDVAATATGWLVVGSVRHGGRTEPVAWSSADGRRWRRVVVPAAGGYGELRRVTRVGATAVAVGLRGGGFGVWSDGGHGWVPVGRFGVVGDRGLPGVLGLTAIGDQIVAAVSTGATAELWISGDRGRSWRELAGPPVAMVTDGDAALAVADAGGRILVAVDDGERAGLWLAGGPVPAG